MYETTRARFFQTAGRTRPSARAMYMYTVTRRRPRASSSSNATRRRALTRVLHSNIKHRARASVASDALKFDASMTTDDASAALVGARDRAIDGGRAVDAMGAMDATTSRSTADAKPTTPMPTNRGSYDVAVNDGSSETAAAFREARMKSDDGNGGGNGVGTGFASSGSVVDPPRTPTNGWERVTQREADAGSSSESATPVVVERKQLRDTPGKGLPWSPRATTPNGNNAPGVKNPSSRAVRAAKARARRSERPSDADVVARFIGDDFGDFSSEAEGGEYVEAAAGPAVEMRVEAEEEEEIVPVMMMHGANGFAKRSAWSTLVSYLRCCVAPSRTSATETGFERARDYDDANDAARENVVAHTSQISGGSSSSGMSCVPCVSQSSVCLDEGFVLHEGDPFIGERDLEVNMEQFRRYEAPGLQMGGRVSPSESSSPADPPKWKPCLVLDLDETLVHSSFKPVPNADFTIKVEIDGKMSDVYVIKRPWVDYFLKEVEKDWEIVVFTASLPKYANPVLDLLDVRKTVRWRLFRRHCYAFQGNYVKDLTCLGRELSQTVIVDNAPYSYAFHPQNALPISTFIDNKNDNELLNAVPYLRDLARCENTRQYLKRTRACTPRASFFSRKGVELPDLDRTGKPATT